MQTTNNSLGAGKRKGGVLVSNTIQSEQSNTSNCSIDLSDQSTEQSADHNTSYSEKVPDERPKISSHNKSSKENINFLSIENDQLGQFNNTEDISDLNSTSEYSKVLSNNAPNERNKSSISKISPSVKYFPENFVTENSTLSEIDVCQPFKETSNIESAPVNPNQENHVSIQIQALHHTLKQTKEINTSLVDALYSIKDMMVKTKSKHNKNLQEKTLSPIRGSPVAKSLQIGYKSEDNADPIAIDRNGSLDSGSEDIGLFFSNDAVNINHNTNFQLTEYSKPSQSTLSLNDHENSQEQIVHSLIFDNSSRNVELATKVNIIESQLLDSKKDNYKLRAQIKHIQQKYKKSQECLTLLTQKFRELTKINKNQTKIIESQSSEIEKEKDDIALKCGELLTEIEQLKNRNNELEQSFDSFNENSSFFRELQDENLQLNNELIKLRKENSELQINLKAKGINNERLITGLKMLKDKYEKLREKKMEPKRKSKELQQSTEPEILVLRLKDDNDTLKFQLNKAEKEKTRLIRNLADSQSQNAKIQSKYKAIQEKYNLLCEESKDNNQIINDLRSNLQTLRNANTSLLATISDIDKAPDKLSSAVSKINELQQKNEELSIYIESFHNDSDISIRQCEPINEEQEKKIEQLNSQLTKERKNNQIMGQQIVGLNTKITELCDTVTALQDKQIDYETIAQQNSSIIQKNMQLVKELNELKDIKDNNILIQLEKSKLFNSLYDICAIIGNQNSKVNIQTIEEAILIINKLKDEYLNQISKFNQLKNQYELYKENLQNQHISLSSNNSSILEKSQQLKEENNQYQIKIQQIEADSLELKTQYEALKSELNSNKENTILQMDELISTNPELSRNTASSETILRKSGSSKTSQISMPSIRNPNSDIKQQNDVSRLMVHIAELEKSSKENEAQLCQTIVQLTKDKEKLAKDLANLRNQKEDLQQRLSLLQNQLDELQLKHSNAIKENQLRREESKNMKSSHMRLMNEFDKNRIQIDTLKHEINKLQEQLHSTLFEKEAIEKTKEELLKERKNELIKQSELESSLKLCESSKNNLKAQYEGLEKEHFEQEANYQKLSIKYESEKSSYENHRMDLEKENLQLKDQIVQLKFDNNYMIAKIANFEQEKSHLDQLKNKLEDLEEDNQRVMLENQQLQDINTKLTQVSNSLQDKINQSKRIRDILFLKDENSQMKVSLENINYELEKTLKKYNELNDSNLQMRIKYERLIHENDILKNTSDQYKKEYITQIDDLNQKNAELTFSKEDLQQSLDREIANCHKVIQELDIAKSANLVLQSQIEKTNIEFTNLNNEMKKMRSHFQAKIEAIIYEKEQTIEKLKIELEKQSQAYAESEKEKRKCQHIVQQLNQEQNCNQSKHFHKNTRAASVGDSKDNYHKTIDKLTSDLLNLKVENENLKRQNQEFMRIHKDHNNLEKLFQIAEAEKEELKQTVNELKLKVHDKFDFDDITTNSNSKNIQSRDIYLATKSLQSIFQTHFRLIIQNINVYISKQFSRFATQILGLTTRVIYIQNKMKYRFPTPKSSANGNDSSLLRVSSSLRESSHAVIQKEIYRGLRKLNIVAPPPNLSLENLTTLLVDSLRPHPIFRFQRRINDVVIKPDKKETKIPSKIVFDYLNDSVNRSDSSEIIMEENSPETAMLLLKKTKAIIQSQNERYHELHTLLLNLKVTAKKNKEHQSLLLINQMLESY